MVDKLDRLTTQLSELQAKKKEIQKQITAEKRKVKAQAEKEKRLQEQAEALEFLQLCKVMKISNKPDAPSVYDWVMGRKPKAETKE